MGIKRNTQCMLQTVSKLTICFLKILEWSRITKCLALEAHSWRCSCRYLWARPRFLPPLVTFPARYAKRILFVTPQKWSHQIMTVRRCRCLLIWTCILARASSGWNLTWMRTPRVILCRCLPTWIWALTAATAWWILKQI